MIALGAILLILGFVLKIQILWTIGIILASGRGPALLVLTMLCGRPSVGRWFQRPRE